MKTIVPKSCRSVQSANAVKIVLPIRMVNKVESDLEDFFRAESAHYNNLRELGWRTPTEIAEVVLGMDREEMRDIRAIVESVLGGTQHIRAPKTLGQKTTLAPSPMSLTSSRLLKISVGRSSRPTLRHGAMWSCMH